MERALGAGVDELAHTPWTRLSDDVLETCAKRLRIVSTLDILSFGRDTPEIRTALDNLRRFHDAGGEVIYGTDLGNGPSPGIHTRELQLLAEAGPQIPSAPTLMVRAPLAAGAPADLIVLFWDPASDPLRRSATYRFVDPAPGGSVLLERRPTPGCRLHGQE